jgi:hypothetical protein
MIGTSLNQYHITASIGAAWAKCFVRETLASIATWL